MKKYIVTITEMLSKDIIVEADSEEHAYQIIKSLYNNEKVILYPEECDHDVTFEVKENIS